MSVALDSFNPYADYLFPAFEEYSWKERIWDAVAARFELIVQVFQSLVRSIRRCWNATPIDLSHIDPGKKEAYPWHEAYESEGLFVYIHGLKKSPDVWDGYIDQTREEYPDAHVVAPFVPKKGNCSLEEAASPILAMVQDYAIQFPAKPIRLIGTSNGGRIAIYLENKLELENRVLQVVSIAGVHFGTKVMSFGSKLKLASMVRLDPTLQKELAFGSDLSKAELKACETKQTVWNKKGVKSFHTFISTRNDDFIRPSTSSSPFLASSTYYNLSGSSHGSIVPKARTFAFEQLRRDLT